MRIRFREQNLDTIELSRRPLNSHWCQGKSEVPDHYEQPMSLSFLRSCGWVKRDGWLHVSRDCCRCCTIEHVVYFDFLFVLTMAIWFNMLLQRIKESENEMRCCNYRWPSKALIRDHELSSMPSHQRVFQFDSILHCTHSGNPLETTSFMSLSRPLQDSRKNKHRPSINKQTTPIVRIVIMSFSPFVRFSPKFRDERSFYFSQPSNTFSPTNERRLLNVCSVRSNLRQLATFLSFVAQSA